jgi:hypothetical protein
MSEHTSQKAETLSKTSERTSLKEVADKKRERNRLSKRRSRAKPGVKERESRAATAKRLRQDDNYRTAFNRRRVLNYSKKNNNMHPLFQSLKNAKRHMITALQSCQAACVERDAAFHWCKNCKNCSPHLDPSFPYEYVTTSLCQKHTHLSRSALQAESVYSSSVEEYDVRASAYRSFLELMPLGGNELPLGGNGARELPLVGSELPLVGYDACELPLGENGACELPLGEIDAARKLVSHARDLASVPGGSRVAYGG